MKKNWISIKNANTSHEELFDDFEAVLSEMGIEIYRDDEEEEKQDVDMFIRLEKKIDK